MHTKQHKIDYEAIKKLIKNCKRYTRKYSRQQLLKALNLQMCNKKNIKTTVVVYDTNKKYAELLRKKHLRKNIKQSHFSSEIFNLRPVTKYANSETTHIKLWKAKLENYWWSLPPVKHGYILCDPCPSTLGTEYKLPGKDKWITLNSGAPGKFKQYHGWVTVPEGTIVRVKGTYYKEIRIGATGIYFGLDCYEFSDYDNVVTIGRAQKGDCYSGGYTDIQLEPLPWMYETTTYNSTYSEICINRTNAYVGRVHCVVYKKEEQLQFNFEAHHC